MATKQELARQELARRELAARGESVFPEETVLPPNVRPSNDNGLPFLGTGHVGALEAGLSMLSGGLAGVPAGLAGIGAAVLPGGQTGPEAVANVSEALTFQPRTAVGKKLNEGLQSAFSVIEEAADTVGEVTGDPEDVLGATAVKTALLGGPALLGFRGGRVIPPTKRQSIAARAQQEGYRVPPGGALEGAGGKLKTQQQASLRNQAVTERLVTKELKLPEGTPIDSAVLSSVRRDASRAYQDVRNAGTVISDKAFRTELNAVTQRFKDAARDFPSLVQRDLTRIVDEIANKGKFQASSAVDAIRLLRDKADAAFISKDKTIANAYKDAANAIESQLERHLQGQGSPAALEAFRNARETIAKTYSVENALVNGEISAARFAAQLNARKPLSGNLKMIGEFAQQFPQSVRLPSKIGNVPSFSPLDLSVGSIGAAASGISGNPLAAAPLIAALARPGIRQIGLSPFGQTLARGPGVSSAPAIPGLIGSGNLRETN